MPDLELLPENRFALRFPYSERIIAEIRLIKGRHWNAEAKHWEFPLEHLGQILKMFRLEATDLDRKLRRAWQMQRLKGMRCKAVTGNVLTRLEGEDLPLDRISDAASFLVPGYKFMPLFKNGKWDGRKRLFDKKRKLLPTGLLPRIISLLESETISVTVEEPTADTGSDDRLPSPAKPVTKAANKAASKEHALRDYQTECIAAAIAGKRGVIQLGTGGGKTLIAAHIIRELKRPAIFLVHTRDLLHQTRGVLADFLRIPIGIAGDGTVELQQVTVATVQTCSRALDIEVDASSDEDEPLEKDPTDLGRSAADLAAFLKSVPVAFFDECHHLPAETTYGLAMSMEGAAWRYGLSATPHRSDRLDLLLEAALGPKLYAAGPSALIEKGYLVPARIEFLPVPPLIIRSGRSPYQEVFDQYVVRSPRRNQLIADKANALAKEGCTVLILVSQVRHGEHLRVLLPDVPLVQGSDPAARRAEVFGGLGKKQILIVIATTLADEGLDVPSLDAVILASPGRSETRALQRVGRALRKAPGKSIARIYDFLDDAPFLKDHAKRRLEVFRSESGFEVIAPQEIGSIQKPIKSKV